MHAVISLVHGKLKESVATISFTTIVDTSHKSGLTCNVAHKICIQVTRCSSPISETSYFSVEFVLFVYYRILLGYRKIPVLISPLRPYPINLKIKYVSNYWMDSIASAKY